MARHQKTAKSAPARKIHAGTGQQYVTVDKRRVYLGRADAPDAEERYRRFVREWSESGTAAIHRRRRASIPTDHRVVELIDRYLQHAERYYKFDGEPTVELAKIKACLRPLRELYGRTPVADFGPTALKAVRGEYVASGSCRRHINQSVGRIRRAFKWGVENELVDPSVLLALQAVSPLKRGRSEAPEGRGVQSVSDAIVDATKPFLTPTLRAMVEVQRRSGMRPGELCIMRTCDLDTSGRVWVYAPHRHKNAYRGHDRKVYLGPKCQDVLRSWLQTDLQAYLFSPARADRERREARTKNRETPLSCGNKPGSNRCAEPKKAPGERYDSASYAKAIRYACQQAFAVPDEIKSDSEAVKTWQRDHWWTPGQLRHAFATSVRKAHGLDAAQVLLGHAKADVTQVYAEVDAVKAERVALRIG